MTYRQEIIKIYQQIDNIAKGGDIYIYEYKKYVDELINNGKYPQLRDVMIQKYGIDMNNFPTIDDFKKNSYNKIKLKTRKNTFNDLKSLLNEKNVYSVGVFYYRIDNDRYLGDIKEVVVGQGTEESLPWIEDRVNLEVIRGLSSSILNAVPPFGSFDGNSFYYASQSQVSYNDKIYESIVSFTYSKTDTITPTYSNYFTQSILPNYLLVEITDNNKSLIEKYSLAIDILKL